MKLLNKVIIFVFLLIYALHSTMLLRAAEVTIDGTATTTTLSMKEQGKVIFTSASVGYMIYRDSAGACRYSKTSDGGANWGGAVNLTAQTDCLGIIAWFDQWTPGDSGTVIHVLYTDSGNDDVWYNTLNTSGDTVGTEAAIDTSAGNTYATADKFTITKSTTGLLYAGFCDGSAAGACAVKKCSATCGTAGNWSAAGTSPVAVNNNYLQLAPLASGDLILIQDAVASNKIQSKKYTVGTTTWDAAWTDVDASCVESATYPNTISVTADTSTNTIYLAFVCSVAVASQADVRTSTYNGSTWTAKTDVATNQNTIISTSIGYDQRSGDVYVGYLQGTAGSNTTAYYKKSVDSMATWGSATQLNTATGDIRFIYLNPSSSDLMYAAYYRNTGTNDDILGNTIASLAAADPSWITGSANFSIYQSSSLTWGAGSLICSGTLTDTNSSTINCTSSTLQASTQYRVEVTLKNVSGTTLKMSGGGDYVDHVKVKTGFAGASPTLGTCAFNDAGSDDTSTTCSASFNGNDVRITNTSGAVNIQTGSTEGFAYLITTDSVTPNLDRQSYFNTSIDSATQLSSYIQISLATVVSVTVSDGSISYGVLPANTQANTTSGGVNDTQVATNVGNVQSSMNIKGQNTACPWTLASSNAADQYVHEFCKTGSGSPDPCDTSPTWTPLTTSYQTLTAGVASGSAQRFDLAVTIPTSTSCFSAQSVDVTVQVVQD